MSDQGKGTGGVGASEGGADDTLVLPKGAGGVALPPPAKGGGEAAALKSLPNYELEKKLGEGGMGSVYRARQTKLDRTVAIKVLPQRLTADAMYTARLQREARVLAKINHPNVITCYDVGEHEGSMYVVMEFVEGESLFDLIQRWRTLPPEEALGYIKQAVLGLDHAFAQGVIHRDIKPDNLLVGKVAASGTTQRINPVRPLKIADLGLASYSGDDGKSTRLTVEGSALGSPHYMSTEQTLGEGNLDFRTDIYALGMTLYHAVTGETPYQAPTVTAVLAKKLSESIPDPREKHPDLDPWLVLLIQKMTARKKEDRYASYGELLHDIEALEQKRPLEARPLKEGAGALRLSPATLDLLKQQGVRSPSSDATVVRGGIGKPPPEKKSSLLLVLVLAGGGMGLVLLALFVLLLSPSASKPAPAVAPAPVVAPPPATPPPANPPPPLVPTLPTPISFETTELISNRSTEAWAAQGDGLIFTYEAEDDALSMLSMRPGLAWAERELPGAQFTFKASVKVLNGADRCEIQVLHGARTCAAFGIKLPRDATKATAYAEKRDLATGKVQDEPTRQEGLDPDTWTNLKINYWDGTAACFLNGKLFCTLVLGKESDQNPAARLAVEKGNGLFRQLVVEPRKK